MDGLLLSSPPVPPQSAIHPHSGVLNSQHRHTLSEDSTDSNMGSSCNLPPPTLSRLPPDGHEFPPDYRDPATTSTAATIVYQVGKKTISLIRFAAAWYFDYLSFMPQVLLFFCQNVLDDIFTRQVHTFFKIHIVWEDHKIWRNLPFSFGLTKVKITSNFCRLLRILQLYLKHKNCFIKPAKTFREICTY